MSRSSPEHDSIEPVTPGTTKGAAAMVLAVIAIAEVKVGSELGTLITGLGAIVLGISAVKEFFGQPEQ